MLILSLSSFILLFALISKLYNIISLNSLKIRDITLKNERIFTTSRFQSKRLHSNKRDLLIIVTFSTAVFVLGNLFFKDIWMATLFAMTGFLAPAYLRQVQRLKNKELLASQFKDGIGILKNALIAGLSIRQGIIYTAQELRKLHMRPDAPIVMAFTKMQESLEMGVALIAVLENFKVDSGIEEIDDFVDITIMTHTRGGNLIEVVGNLEQMIGTKIQVRQEIGTLTASKVFESKILTLMPFVMVILLTLMSPDYMRPLYETTMGKVLMILGVVLITINFQIGKKIVRIDV